jgi:hypothetical protein
MSMANVSPVTLGLFDDSEFARHAVAALKAVGFAAEDIGLMESTRGRAVTPARSWSRPGSARGVSRANSSLPPTMASIAGLLVGRGMPVDRAEYYASEVRNGNSLVAVRTRGYGELAQTVLHRFGAYDVRTAARSTWRGLRPVPKTVPAPIAS